MPFDPLNSHSDPGNRCGVQRSREILRQALAMHQAGDPLGAERAYRDVIATDPDNAAAAHFLGMLKGQAGAYAEALALILLSVRKSPRNANFRSNLGTVYAQSGEHLKAVDCFREAIRLDPSLPEAHKNLGLSLEALERWADSSDAYSRALALRPGDMELIAHRTRVAALGGTLPGNPMSLPGGCTNAAWSHTLSVLGSVYERAGQLSEAIAVYRNLLSSKISASSHSAFLYMLLHEPTIRPSELFRQHLLWSERHAKPLQRVKPETPKYETSNRQLRIGYVSPDFRDHTTPRYIEPLLRGHDRSAFAVYCYSDARSPDSVTASLAALPVHWRRTANLRDDEFCQCVRTDQIDILIELSGHMAGNRLLALTQRPAPVQLTYLYPHSTGLDCIAGRITDGWADPNSVAEGLNTERLVRLSKAGWCYRNEDSGPPISGLPALATGRITFGALNRAIKTSAPMLQLWARLLRLVRHSRLLILVEGETDVRRVQNALARQGVSRDRIIPIVRRSRREYLELSRRVDIALDTYPFNGQTTSYDMLWMGVPVITLVGQTPASRIGLGILQNLGLNGCIAFTGEDYIRAAADLACDFAKLRSLRNTLRERLKASVLMDAKGFVSRVEAAYRSVWEQHLCAAAG